MATELDPLSPQEGTPAPSSSSSPSSPASSSSSPIVRASVASIFLIAAGCAAIGATLEGAGEMGVQLVLYSHAATSADQEGKTGDSGALEISFRNSYGTPDEIAKEYPWTVVEPHRVTTLSTTGRLNNRFEWYLDDVNVGSGAEIEFTCTEVGGLHTLRVDTICDECPGGEEENTRSTSEQISCKYVRREIRSLSDDDREAFFSAARMLYQLPTEAGQRVFGDDFKSSDYFTRKHLYYAGTKDCDHWHEGAGFVTSHMAITLEWEKAVQAVNPAVSVPYWDFTVESTLYDADTWRESPVFSDDWFGEASPDNAMHTVTEGRWAYTPTMSNAWNFSKVTNSYGLLRSPWNNDPTPFLTRHQNVYGYENPFKPRGCDDYAACLLMDDWMSLSKCLNTQAHGRLHELVGGSWGFNMDALLAHMDEDVAARVMSVVGFHEVQAMSRLLYRSDDLACPDYCSMDTPFGACACHCPADVLDRPAYEVLNEAGVIDSIKGSQYVESVAEEGAETPVYRFIGLSEEENAAVMDGILQVLCTPGQIGDMYSSTSTNDIIFWVLHPTIDRLWHYMRLAPEVYDETWDDDHPCYGHNSGDVQPFQDLFFESDRGDAEGARKWYTNSDLYRLLNPENPMLSYAYDEFSWPHCEAEGYTMGN